MNANLNRPQINELVGQTLAAERDQLLAKWTKPTATLVPSFVHPRYLATKPCTKPTKVRVRHPSPKQLIAQWVNRACKNTVLQTVGVWSLRT